MKYNTDIITQLQTAAEFLKVANASEYPGLLIQCGKLFSPGTFYSKVELKSLYTVYTHTVPEPAKLAKSAGLMRPTVFAGDNTRLSDGKKHVNALYTVPENLEDCEYRFPAWHTDEFLFSIEAAEFKAFVSNAKRFTAPKTSAFESLRGLAIKNGYGVACDGYIAYRKKLIQDDAEELLINRPLAETLAKTAAGTINIYRRGLQVFYDTDDFVYIDHIKEGLSFCDVSSVFREDLKETAEIKSDAIKDSLNFLSVSDKTNKNLVFFKEDRMDTYFSEASDVSGMAFDTETAFNLKYLINAVSIFPKNTTVEARHGGSPVHLIAFRSGSEEVVVLPVRVADRR